MELVKVTSYSVIVELPVDEASLLAAAVCDPQVVEQHTAAVFALAGFLNAVRWLPLAFGNTRAADLCVIMPKQPRAAGRGLVTDCPR